MSNRVITINRMFGSNGRIIGKTLAEELGFKFYDKELIEMASREKNICLLYTSPSSRTHLKKLSRKV